jgi:hypothetical protein
MSETHPLPSRKLGRAAVTPPIQRPERASSPGSRRRRPQHCDSAPTARTCSAQRIPPSLPVFSLFLPLRFVNPIRPKIWGWNLAGVVDRIPALYHLVHTAVLVGAPMRPWPRTPTLWVHFTLCWIALNTRFPVIYSGGMFLAVLAVWTLEGSSLPVLFSAM